MNEDDDTTWCITWTESGGRWVGALTLTNDVLVITDRYDVDTLMTALEAAVHIVEMSTPN